MKKVKSNSAEIIKEPEGITFYVENRELTKEEKEMRSDFFC